MRVGTRVGTRGCKWDASWDARMQVGRELGREDASGMRVVCVGTRYRLEKFGRIKRVTFENKTPVRAILENGAISRQLAFDSREIKESK